jgi:electron-transferring-flavoprotein dehydrogenase
MSAQIGTSVRDDREHMVFDIVIVGAGPAGLSCAIRLHQLCQERNKESQNKELNICVIEKGSEVGAHLLSGAVFETKALDELIPDWKEQGAPLTCEAKSDSFYFMTEKKALPLPTPPAMHNKGNYIISLGVFGKWLGQYAENLGIQIFPGFAASEVLYDDQDHVIGVATGDMGIQKDGEKGPLYQAGYELHAKLTIFAEGCHGSLTKQLINKFDLRKESCPQTYGLGIKEVWEIKPEQHKQGWCMHSLGWPLDKQTYGGSWMYHMEDNLVSLGFVVGLDYKNPYLSPFEEMQRFKTHPFIRKMLDGGKRVSYGARTLVEGGLQSLPQLTVNGGMIIGDSAGFLNVSKIKGNHTAMKSGMLAAETAFEAFETVDNDTAQPDVSAYPAKIQGSWLWKELNKARNIRPGFAKWGLWGGMIHAAFQSFGGWRLPYTLKHGHADHETTGKAVDYSPIEYPKPDNELTFDRLSSVFLTGTNHAEDQPSHLVLADTDIPISKNLPDYAEPARLYCPAAVYEIVEEEGQQQFKINAQNCIHCKTCDIKDPLQNINWTVPQGGEGPNYSGL